MKRTTLSSHLVAALASCTEDDALVPDPSLVTGIDENACHAITIGSGAVCAMRKALSSQPSVNHNE